jgi:molybdopterin molybdotransferase
MIEIKDLKVKMKSLEFIFEDFKFEKGKVTIISGRNGAGKTTLLRVFASFLDYEGSLKINSNVTYNSQEPVIFNRTAYCNIAYPLKVRKLDISKYHDKIVEYSKLLDIEHLLDTNALKLSSGEKMKVSIIRSTKTILLSDALNYVIAEDVISNEDVPHFNRSVVDGYAVNFNSVKLATSSTPSILKHTGEVLMGTESLDIVTPNTTVYVPTGGHLPKGSNAVVMIENTELLGEEVIINKSVSKNENVLLKGTDISIGQLILSKNTLVTPLIIGSLKAIGIDKILVFEKLTSLVISTGDEIVKDKEFLNIGEIRDINTYTISNHLSNKNIVVKSSLIINDDFIEYKNAVLKGFESSDIVFSSGGSSVGEKDYTLAILREIGAEILVHGINIKPGKPSIIAKYNNKLFFGLPGQPTSAFFVLNTFINEIINTIYNIKNVVPIPYFEARLDSNVHSPTGRRMYQLVNIKLNNKEFIATPLFAKSGMIHSLTLASGYIIIDESSEGYTENSIVKVYRLGD